MHDGLPAWLEPAAQEMRVGVAAEQHELEEQHARRPYARRAAEPRQDVFADEGLNEEEQERPGEDRQRKWQHGNGPPVNSAQAESSAEDEVLRRLGKENVAAPLSPPKTPRCYKPQIEHR